MLTSSTREKQPEELESRRESDTHYTIMIQFSASLDFAISDCERPS